MRTLEHYRRWAIAFVTLIAAAIPATASVSVEAATDRMGSDYAGFDLPAPDPARCAKACDDDATCKAYTYVKPGVQGPKPRCYLKSAVPPATASACCVSGVKTLTLRTRDQSRDHRLATPSSRQQPTVSERDPSRDHRVATPSSQPQNAVFPGVIVAVKPEKPGPLGRGQAVGSLNGAEIAHLPKCAKSTGNTVFGVLDKIAEWFGGDVTYDARCGTYQRELAAGVTLGPPASPPGAAPRWQHMGGAGDLMADAMICLMKDIGEAPGGRISRKASTSVAGVGLSLTQHVGLTKFEPTAKRAEIYHQQRVCAPLLGCMDTQRQIVTAQIRASTPAWPAGMKAGDYPVVNSYALEIAADWANTTFGAKVPPITIDTPYGSATLQPQFSFHSSLYPVDTPFAFKGSPTLYLHHPKAVASFAPIVQDSYGRSGIPFMLNVAAHYKPPETCVPGGVCVQATYDPAPPPSGWSSQILFGARNGEGSSKIWSPAAGAKWPERPDLGLETARSKLERSPSVNFNAMSPATIKPPVANLMASIPSEVKALIGDIGVEIVVTPRFDASFAGQLGFVEREGLIKACTGAAEFKNSCSLAEALLFTQARAHGEMKIQSHLRFWIDFTFEMPFFDPDIDKTITLPSIPLAAPSTDLDPDKAGADPYAPIARASVISSAPGAIAGQLVKGPSGNSHANIRQWTEQCMKTPPKTSSLPGPTHEPGKPDDLAPTLLPCNICVADKRQKKYKPFVFPEVKNKTYPAAKNWTCAWEQNLGCHDLCTFQKNAAGKTVFTAAVVSALDTVGGHCKMPPTPIPR